MPNDPSYYLLLNFSQAAALFPPFPLSIVQSFMSENYFIVGFCIDRLFIHLFSNKKFFRPVQHFLNFVTIPVSKLTQEKLLSSNVLRLHINGKQKALFILEVMINLYKKQKLSFLRVANITYSTLCTQIDRILST